MCVTVPEVISEKDSNLENWTQPTLSFENREQQGYMFGQMGQIGTKWDKYWAY